MLTWAIIFFIISVLAGLFGFKSVQSASTTIAKVLFFIFLVLFIISLVFGLVSMESY